MSDMSSDKPVVDLSLLQGGAKKDELAEAIRQARATWDLYVQAADLIAKEQKVKFDALVKHGFTPVQALQLVK
jgi:hypothetical protein